jgi:hypothetical protein
LRSAWSCGRPPACGGSASRSTRSYPATSLAGTPAWEGRPVDAQFRRVAGADGRRALALDFVSGVGPLETERYVVEVGDGVEPGPEPKRAVRVEREGMAWPRKPLSAFLCRP